MLKGDHWIDEIGKVWIARRDEETSIEGIPGREFLPHQKHMLKTAKVLTDPG